MKLTCYPCSFNVSAGMNQTADGDQPVMRIIYQDVLGDIVEVMLGIQDWPAFQAAVADPEKFAAEQRREAAAAEARARIVLGQRNGMPPAGGIR